MASSWVEDLPCPVEIHERKSKPSRNAVHIAFGPPIIKNGESISAAKSALRIQLDGGRSEEQALQAAINSAAAEFRGKLELCSEIIGELLTLRSVPVDTQVFHLREQHTHRRIGAGVSAAETGYSPSRRGRPPAPRTRRTRSTAPCWRSSGAPSPARTPRSRP